MYNQSPGHTNQSQRKDQKILIPQNQEAQRSGVKFFNSHGVSSSLCNGTARTMRILILPSPFDALKLMIDS